MSALARATLYIVVLFLSGLAKAPQAYAQEAEAEPVNDNGTLYGIN